LRVGVIGISEMISTRSGHFVFATSRACRKARKIVERDRGCAGLENQEAAGAFAEHRVGIGTMAHCAIAWCALRIVSVSGAIEFDAARLITSFSAPGDLQIPARVEAREVASGETSHRR